MTAPTLAPAPRPFVRVTSALLVLFAVGVSGRADDRPTTAPAPTTLPPAVIDASDTVTVLAAMEAGGDVVVRGTVKLAEWSRSGKVMNIEFEDTGDKGFLAVAFERNRAKLDAAFSGDAAKAFTGATLRLRGKIEPSGSKAERYAGRPQMVLNDTSAVTIE
jgi:hypothetical protein